MIRVILADDEQLIRQGLRRLLELANDIEVVDEACDGEQVLAALRSHPVDVIALDIRMPRMDGLRVLEVLKARAIATPCLILTTFDDPGLLLEAARRGAQGFVSKDISLEELVAALRAVAAGATWFQPVVTTSLRESFRHRNGETVCRSETLTEREVDVLRLMAGGLTNREIATTLHTAEGTVKNQVSSILGKMGVRDRTVAVLNAIEAGLV